MWKCFIARLSPELNWILYISTRIILVNHIKLLCMCKSKPVLKSKNIKRGDTFFWYIYFDEEKPTRSDVLIVLDQSKNEMRLFELGVILFPILFFYSTIFPHSYFCQKKTYISLFCDCSFLLATCLLNYRCSLIEWMIYLINESSSI